MKPVTATPKQIATLKAVQARAKASTSGTVKMSDAEYNLAKSKFLAAQKAGMPIPAHVLEIAKRLGFI